MHASDSQQSSIVHNHHQQTQPNSQTTSATSGNTNFWKQPGGVISNKLPGRVVMRAQTVRETYNGGSKPGTPTKTNNSHRRNNSTSFELFTASCDDAWDSKIEDEEYLAHPLQSATTNMFSSFKTPNSSMSNSNSVFGDGRVKIPATSSVVTTSNKINTTMDPDPKLTKFKKILFEDEVTDLNQLRSLAWAGIPNQVRPITWKLLLGYLPIIKAKREAILERKRGEYQNLVHQYYENRSSNDEIWRQIHIDIPRMQPLISIFQQPLVQGIFERILYIWSIRHPASGYVQGMNDLVTPFFVTYLSEFIPDNALSKVESFVVSELESDVLNGIEADVFWSYSKLLDSIQDNYTFAQPGIQHLVHMLAKVMSRVDTNLHEHLTKHNVQYLQFAFRWMNNLLIREIPLRCIVRLWDTYLAEGAVTTAALPTPSLSPSTVHSIELGANSEFSNSWTTGNGTPFSGAFHLFVCAAFLRFWSKTLLQEKDFQGLMLLLQNLPTFHWTDNEVKLLVADAYQLKYTFSPNHLKI